MLTLLSPCSAILLPAFFAYAFSSDQAIIGRTLIFLAGLLTSLVPLGVAASTVGMFFSEHRSVVVVVASVVVIALGLMQVLGIPLPLPGAGRSGGRANSVAAVYLLGTVYGIAGVCSGPILGSLLAVAAAGGNAFYGGTLLAIYSLGMALPVLVLSVLWQRFDLGRRRWLKPRPVEVGPIRTTITAVVSGGLFVALGTLMLLTGGTANLGGVLTVEGQFRSESAVQAWSRSVPDLLVVVVLVMLVGAAAVILNRWPRRLGPEPQSQSERTVR